ncbi:MAG TPA: hypothetical protein VJZ26_07540 [Blastocatellia bacterium]|nr:hypothetical protein [Blastocatellia bacterium]
MIRVLLLDLGETLVHGDTIFPNVKTALEALANFRTEANEPLALALVSDFTMPTPPVTAQKIETIFRDYVAELDGFGLTSFFEPVKQHATLSTHAGVFKPDRRIFEMALSRLGVSAGLGECLFITENAGHIAACQNLGMKTLQFDGSGAPGSDFSDWAEAPPLIAHMVAPESETNLELALKAHLAAAHEMELIAMKKDPANPNRRIRGRATKWTPVPAPQQSGEQSLDVPLPVDVDIETDEKGRVRSVKSGQPDPEDVEEAKAFVETLEANKQVAHQSGPLPPGTTHKVETDKKGRKRLVRKRFSAI